MENDAENSNKSILAIILAGLLGLVVWLGAALRLSPNDVGALEGPEEEVKDPREAGELPSVGKSLGTRENVPVDDVEKELTGDTPAVSEEEEQETDAQVNDNKSITIEVPYNLLHTIKVIEKEQRDIDGNADLVDAIAIVDPVKYEEFERLQLESWGADTSKEEQEFLADSQTVFEEAMEFVCEFPSNSQYAGELPERVDLVITDIPKIPYILEGGKIGMNILDLGTASSSRELGKLETLISRANTALESGAPEILEPANITSSSPIKLSELEKFAGRVDALLESGAIEILETANITSLPVKDEWHGYIEEELILGQLLELGVIEKTRVRGLDPNGKALKRVISSIYDIEEHHKYDVATEGEVISEEDVSINNVQAADYNPGREVGVNEKPSNAGKDMEVSGAIHVLYRSMK